MSNNPPEIIAINNDEEGTKHVGRTEDGTQFFLTAHSTLSNSDVFSEADAVFIALYLFDNKGNLEEAIVDKFDLMNEANDEKRVEMHQFRLKSLGKVEYCRIEVKPGAAEIDGREGG